MYFFFFSSRRRHTRWPRDWSSDVCSSDLCNRGALFGFSTEERAAIARAAEDIAIVFAPNMSIGVNITLKLVEIEIGRASCRERGRMRVEGGAGEERRR